MMSFLISHHFLFPLLQKKYFRVFLLVLFPYLAVHSQPVFYAPFGGPFTPKGDLRILIIFAGFENDCGELREGDWPDMNDHQPACKTFHSGYRELFYTDYSQFRKDAKDLSISNFFYQMSGGATKKEPFRLVADFFPERINISGTRANNRLVFQQIQEKYPDFDWNRYDKRKNNPDFAFDNSLTEPDHIIDYIVVIWRVHGASGYAATDNFTFKTNAKGYSETYQVKHNNGFTMDKAYWHLPGIKKLFLHELAHSLYNCPHLYGTNGVHGDYFYSSSGWSMMMYGTVNNSCNAWESWYLGWIDLPKEKDLYSAAENGIYTLKDFITTGDAMRIKLPFCDQYLWLENHAGFSIFDERESFSTDGKNNPIPPSPKGLLMYIENLTARRDVRLNALSLQYANGMKAMHAGGNFDYQTLGYSRDEEWWNNIVVNFKKGEANPLGPHNDITLIRDNYEYEANFPSLIVHRNYTNNRNESCSICKVKCPANTFCEASPVLKKENRYVYSEMGSEMAFGTGRLPQKIGISHNPAIVNLQRYDICKAVLEPVLLNGISINIISIASDGSITFELKFNDTDIRNNQRFTGNLLLNKIDNADYDLKICSGATLILDKSGSPNRHTQGEIVNGNPEFPDFINPTVLTAEKDTRILIEDNATFIIRKGSSLYLKDEAALIIKGTGKLIVEEGAYFASSPGAKIILEDETAAIEVKKGSIALNPLSGIHADSLLNVCDLPLITQGKGFLTGTSPVKAGDDRKFKKRMILGPPADHPGNFCWTLADGSSAGHLLHDVNVKNPRLIFKIKKTTTFRMTYTEESCKGTDDVTIFRKRKK